MLLDPEAWFFYPSVAGALVALALFAIRGRTPLLLCAGLAIALVLLAQLSTAWWAWFFRDGMGPDSVESVCGQSWARWRRLYQIALAIGPAEGGALVAPATATISRIRVTG